MNIRHIPFLNEQDPDTGYDMSADAPTTCPNGEDLPCDCRNFWVVRARKDTDFTPYAYSALRCDAHGKQPISDCKRYSDSLRDVLIAAGFRYRGFWWLAGWGSTGWLWIWWLARGSAGWLGIYWLAGWGYAGWLGIY